MRQTSEWTLSQLAQKVAGQLVVCRPVGICRAVSFDQAGPQDITFADSPAFLNRIDQSQAGAIIVPSGFTQDGHNLIQTDNPRAAFAAIRAWLHAPHRPAAGIHETAVIGQHFDAGQDIIVGPHVCIGNDVRLGDRVWLHPGVVIGDEVIIGDDTVIYPHVAILRNCRIGRRGIVHAGTVIGSDGFGFAPENGTYVKIAHTGAVCIEDDVEIGANNAIDRATYGQTHIGQGVKTDNLVHIAHNVTIGAHTVIVAQVGLSGSVTVGHHAVLAGQAGVAGHLRIGDHAMVGGQCGVGQSIADGQMVSGSPAMAHRLWLRVQRLITRLPDLFKRVRRLEKKLETIENNS